MLQPAKSALHYVIYLALLNAQSAQDDLLHEAIRNGWNLIEALHRRRKDEAKAAFDAFKETMSEDDSDCLYGYIRHCNDLDDVARSAA